jgi:hypothetical protein
VVGDREQNADMDGIEKVDSYEWEKFHEDDSPIDYG